MDRTCVVIAGVGLAIALGPAVPPGSASATTPSSADRSDLGFLDLAPTPIGESVSAPSLVDAPPLASPSYFDGMLAQRVLDDDEERPKVPGEEEEERRVLTRKNPWVAMGLSAVLPGAGQFYLDKSNPLAFAYVGVEALALYLHFAWEADGEEKTREFEEYAFQGMVVANAANPLNYDVVTNPGSHWNWQDWRDSFRDPPAGCIDPTTAGHVGTEVDSMLIEFWFDNRREFYEDIGKYDKYDCGWVNPEDRDIYRSMRNETNDILERARLMTQVVLLNHLASSIHAFFLARSHNKHVEEMEREASLRQLHWQFSPDRDFRGLRAQLWLTQKF